ncbi:MAG: diguanylate cyclase [Nitrospirae bacterium]|nr:diguanylate cyclase [Nitrospirota bacterium]
MVKSNLLRGILLISLCSVVFLPVYTLFFLYPSFDRLLTERTEEEAARFAAHLASRLIPVNSGLTREVITPAFRQAIEQSAKDMQLVKVKVFAPSGEIIYSTDPKDIGEINRKKYFIEIVARGSSYTQVVKKSSQSLEGQVMNTDVVETYVPLMDGQQFDGAFELYYDITKSREKLGRLISRSSAVVFVVALCLLVGVVLSAVNANRSIRSRDSAEEELRRHQDDLEKLVEERTREIVRAHQEIEKEMFEKKQVEGYLQDTEAKYQSLVESTEDSIYLVDKSCRYLFINKKHLNRMGLLPDQVLGHDYQEFHSPEETSKFMEHVNRVFETGDSVQSEHMSKRDNKYFLQTLSPVKDLSGSIVAITVISKDISDRKRMEEELLSLSLTDELTGLYNRRGFLALADQYLKIVNRMKNKISILYADLDDLKTINDVFGHKEGDRAIIEAAGILRETFRESDVAARIGGDEFVVMPAVISNASLGTILARLHNNIALVNARAGRSYQISISYGIAYYDPEEPCTIEELLDRGDRMMYENKKSKNHRV